MSAQSPTGEVRRALLAPERVTTREEALDRPSPVPAAPGVYAWYFDRAPAGVPLAGTSETEFGHLLYVGISPKGAPDQRQPADTSRQSLRTRIRYHFRGNAAGSTLRLTLGSLLAEEIGVELRRVGSGARFTFGVGEAAISDWMAEHARVCWFVDDTPWISESRLISELVLPLNLDQNRHSGFHTELSKARRTQRDQARALPIVPR
ncbi:GIY-YIG nuclease family protein [Xylanimonas ulmi]|uniref:GIY-YIG catalytic domain-containing protein n=1 Tax=Xylanimonas ulmi TaxID=228973 RepID=A0A4Q7M0P1_9MICO|nr:hypothetical protein [Xylanibacterium ulmi]RZS60751.1 hypothetical protein EV386_1030 [Xylanibacterium ulmi]